MDKKKIVYEDSAELRKNLSGWVCTECNRYWGKEEDLARRCCATDTPCRCGNRITSYYSMCEECITKAQEKRQLKRLEEAKLCEYDGNPFVVDGEFYFKMDYYLDDIANGTAERSEYAYMTTQMSLELDAEVIWMDVMERLEMDSDYDIDPEGYDEFKLAVETFVARNQELNHWQEDWTRKFKLPTLDEV
jgi:hypothetical protein